MKNILLSIPFLLCSCNNTGKYLKVVGELDKNEISGIQYIQKTKDLWALEDSGNKNEIYRLDKKGDIQHTVEIKGVENEDWEDMTADSAGNIYIGDFGNNDNERKDLVIYKVSHTDLRNDEVKPEYEITFKYEDQEEFPPKKSERYFDVEAFFEKDGFFYLFTKNRSAGFNGDFSVYKLPNKAGNYTAKRIATLNSCGAYRKCAIAAADISPDGKTIVLLGGDKVWLIEQYSDTFNQDQVQQYELAHYSQKEGVTFKDNNTLLIADEKNKGTGGLLYEIKISQLKAER